MILVIQTPFQRYIEMIPDLAITISKIQSIFSEVELIYQFLYLNSLETDLQS